MPTYRFGKHPPKIDYRTLRLKNYLTPALPAPPATFNVLAEVYTKLHQSDPTKLFPMDNNSQYGDCTIAALAHAITVYSGKIGKLKVMTQPQVVALYMKLTGGVDSGLNELNVLNYWHNNAVDGDKILAYVSVNPKNHTEVQQAIELFGGVYLGFQVQQNCQQEFEAHQPWTPGPLTQDGHAVYAVEYDPTYLTVLTWGNVQKATWPWWDECVDEAYAILAPEAEAAGFDPGFNFAQLQADLAAL
jgi:hypothetical protein